MRALLLLCLLPAILFAGEIPLRIDGPETGEVPIRGGIPFPQGALADAKQIVLKTQLGVLPSQATTLAKWPDGSVKWALIDKVDGPHAKLTLQYGPDVKPSEFKNVISAQEKDGAIEISGGSLKARISKTGGGFIDELAFNGETLIAPDKPSRLVVDVLRIPDGTSGTALPTHTFVCRDPKAKVSNGKVQIEKLEIESPGPIRVTVLIRGFILLENFGATLPKEVLDKEPAGRMPFSMRVSFYRGSSIITAQHQIVFSGEPDCDFITRWGVVLPGMATKTGRMIAEPGVALDLSPEGTQTLSTDQSRLSYGELKRGVAVIRKGWENRPTAVTMSPNGDAAIEFWPAAAGPFDLRRYAREWACGESGDTKNAADIEKFAKYAARGLAKSHDFAIDFRRDAKPETIAEPALLLAPPGWYTASGVLGPCAPEQTAGEFAPIDAASRRRIDYHLFCQDLFRWYGQLTYGFWQYRYGQMHRNDRWDCDYGRWGWALNDGAGRIGHALMLQFLRTQERRYFDAGFAFNRINYDTNLVHTELHLENSRSWWHAAGYAHRHNVQPFGCPYMGLRGSNPVGQRMLWELTGDGVISDGLELVAANAIEYARGNGSRLGNSGGSDGQGSAAHALLWKFEATGDKQYLELCRKVLDLSGMFPPKDINSLGYGPGFGLFNAAGEYALLSGDKDFQTKLVETAKLATTAKNNRELIGLIAYGAYFSNDKTLKDALAALLKQAGTGLDQGLEDQPPETWPGHGGWKTPVFSANEARDLPLAMAVAQPVPQKTDLSWPKLQPMARAIPATAPKGWYVAGGAQGKQDRDYTTKLQMVDVFTEETAGGVDVGNARFSFDKQGLWDMNMGEIKPLLHAANAFIETVEAKGNPSAANIARVEPTNWSFTNGLSLNAEAGAERILFSIQTLPIEIEKIPAIRLYMSCHKADLPEFTVASWGLRIPLKLSKNGNALQTTAPGAFRLERCRLDQNDERIANWQSSEYHWGEGAPLWPKWRESGIDLCPGSTYRIWRANRTDCVPVYCDQGEGSSNWLDVTDRGANPRWGLTARVLRAKDENCTQTIRVNFETGELLIEFHSSVVAPMKSAHFSGTVDLILHDGFRPPLAKPELTAAQFEKFIDDLNYNENYGLNALRFALSITHKVQGREWMEKIRDLGIEPREILYGMQYGGALEQHCKKAGVLFDAKDIEGTVRKIIEHYRK